MINNFSFFILCSSRANRLRQKRKKIIVGNMVEAWELARVLGIFLVITSDEEVL